MVPPASGLDLNLVAMVTGIKISSGAGLRRNLNSQVTRHSWKKPEEKVNCLVLKCQTSYSRREITDISLMFLQKSSEIKWEQTETESTASRISLQKSLLESFRRDLTNVSHCAQICKDMSQNQLRNNSFKKWFSLLNQDLHVHRFKLNICIIHLILHNRNKPMGETSGS